MLRFAAMPSRLCGRGGVFVFEATTVLWFSVAFRSAVTAGVMLGFGVVREDGDDEPDDADERSGPHEVAVILDITDEDNHHSNEYDNPS